MKFLKNAVRALNYCTWSMPLKFLMFWAAMFVVFVCIVWNISAATCALTERHFLADIVEGKRAIVVNEFGRDNEELYNGAQGRVRAYNYRMAVGQGQ